MNIVNGNGLRKGASDIDGVLLDFHGPFLVFYNERHGTNFTVEDATSYNFSDIVEKTGITQEEFERDMLDFYQTPSFRNLPLIPGAQEAIRRLSKRYTLSIITSRPERTLPITMFSLRTNFPFAFSEVHFTRRYDGGGDKQRKCDFCLRHGYGLIIEDVAEYANECAEAGIEVILLNKPWNKDEPLHKEVRRAADWERVLKILK